MPNAEIERFARMRQLSTPLQTTAFRAISPEFATVSSALSTAGSVRTGGRYNPRHEFGALYLSLHPSTCIEEVSRFSQSNLNSAALSFPRTIIAIRVALLRVLDLTSGTAIAGLAIDPELLIEPGWFVAQNSASIPYTQQLGRAAFHAEIEGLVVPSAAHAGYTNLVVFADHLLPGSSLTIVNEEQLAAGPS